MANSEHLAILKEGVEAWNAWRRENRLIVPDLSVADLNGAYLSGADLHRGDLGIVDLSGANLNRADLRGANLFKARLFEANLSDAYLTGANLFVADLREADLSRANLHSVDLREADLSESNLSGVELSAADLRRADLREANLTNADLRQAQLIGTNFEGATLEGCKVYGISAWDLQLDKDTIQKNLIITKHGEPEITVDNLEVAQFIYLLLNNEKIRDTIQTIGEKAVLILGRFTPERKAVLDAIREEIRKRGFIPILFDFEKPDNRDLTETIRTLAHLSRFIIADITDAKSIPQELQAIVPNLPSVAVQPIIQTGNAEYAMFEHFRRFDWVLPVHEYASQEQLILELSEKVIAPAEAKVLQLREPSVSGITSQLDKLSRDELAEVIRQAEALKKKS